MTEIKNIQCNCCGEYIPVGSSYCPYCGEPIKSEDEEITQDEEVKTERPSYLKNIFIGLIVLLLVCGFVFIAFFLFEKLNPEITLFKPNEPTRSSALIPKVSKSKGIKEAKILFEQEKFDESAEILQQEIENNNADAYYYMAEIYNKRNYVKLAIKTYKQAEVARDNFFEPKKRLAQLYWRMNEFDQALNYAESANKINSSDLELLELLFQIYNYQNNTDKALAICKNIVNLDSKNYNANYYLANYYYGKNNFRDTIPYLENLLKDRYDTQLSYTLVLCYAHIEYYTKAIEVLDKIIANDSYEYYYATYLKANVKSLREQYRIEHGMQ